MGSNKKLLQKKKKKKSNNPKTKWKDNPQNGRKYCEQSNPQGITLQNISIQTAHVAQ